MRTSYPPPSVAPQVAVVGKTPRMGDFLRVGSAGPAGEAFEQWIEQGLALAEAKRGGAWHAAYASGATYAFVYRAPRAANVRDPLVGVIKPSFDAVGRRYPLVVYAPVARGQIAWPHVMPMALGEFLDAAVGALFEAEIVSGVAEMQAVLRQVPPPHLGDAERNAYEYDAWAAATPLAHAWNVVYGGDSSLSAPRAVHTIAEAVAPFRGEEAPATKLGLRLPLGPGGVAAAAFWLDTVRRLARSPAEVRTCFWSFDGASGCAIVQLGETPPSALAELWSPDPNSDYLCDLSLPTSVDVGRFLTRLPAPVADVLQSPGALVRDFLERLTV